MRKSVVIVGALLIASLSSYSSRADSQRIMDLETLQREVVGRPLENRQYDARVVIEPNGKLSGSRDNHELSGKWELRDGYFCRSYLEGMNISQEDCNTVFLDDDGITIIRAKGRGDRIKYQFVK